MTAIPRPSALTGRNLPVWAQEAYSDRERRRTLAEKRDLDDRRSDEMQLPVLDQFLGIAEQNSWPEEATLSGREYLVWLVFGGEPVHGLPKEIERIIDTIFAKRYLDMDPDATESLQIAAFGHQWFKNLCAQILRERDLHEREARR